MCGYEIKCPNHSSISVFYSIYLWIQNKLYKQIFALKRYGLVLYICEKITRMFKMEKFHTHLIIRINDIKNNYLK